MMGIQPYKSENGDVKLFETCLGKITKIKNLTSIGFIYDNYSYIVDKWSSTHKNIRVKFFYKYDLSILPVESKFCEWSLKEIVKLGWVDPKVLIELYEKYGNPQTDNNESSDSVDIDYQSMSFKQLIRKYTPEHWEDFFDGLGDDIIDPISQFLQNETKIHKVYPPLDEMLTVFDLCPPSNIRVIVIGQDPYHTKGAAMGLAFSHHDTRKRIQPSLQNIYKELKNDGYKAQKSGNLSAWVEQGVFLINTALTVRERVAASHTGVWEKFTEVLLGYLNKVVKHAVVVAWGKKAQGYAEVFNNPNHIIIKSAHPSPFSAHSGFFGSKPFSRTNEYLKKWNMREIDWNLA
jgi:uracil-DNA glycosylase